jgi:hypothetical protein
MRRVPMLPILALALALAAGCTLRPKVSDTGYTGTWSRGNDRNISLVAIAKSGDRYAFRWLKHAYEGMFDITCGWDGTCEEKLQGKTVATYRFRARPDPATGHLMVECDERRIEPEKQEFHYVDELVVEPGGKVLWSYTIQRDGQKYEASERPMRSFDKVADAVAGVPVFDSR